TVRDEGRWRAPRTDLGTRRRGFLLMRRLMDAIEVDRAEGGTTVVMRRGIGRTGTPAPSPAPAPEAVPATARGPARASVAVEARVVLAVPPGAPVRRLLEISGVERSAGVATSVATGLAAAEG